MKCKFVKWSFLAAHIYIHTNYPCPILSSIFQIVVLTKDKMTYTHITRVPFCPPFSKSLASPRTKWYTYPGTKIGNRDNTLFLHMRHFSKSSSLLTDDEHDVTNVMHKIRPCFTNAECTDPKRNFE